MAPLLLSLSRLTYSVRSCIHDIREVKGLWTTLDVWESGYLVSRFSQMTTSYRWPYRLSKKCSVLFGLKKLAPLTKLVRLTCSRSSDHLILAFWVLAYRMFGCIIVFRFKKYHWGFWHRCLLEPIGRGTASFRYRPRCLWLMAGVNLWSKMFIFLWIFDMIVSALFRKTSQLGDA